MNTLNAPSSDKSFQQEIARWHGTTACRNLEIEGYSEVNSPSPYVRCSLHTDHSVLHALNEGIGLRQVCDWAYLLHHHADTLDLKEIADCYSKNGLTKAARIFGVIATRYLGLPMDKPADPLY
ncbi:MAG: nucleotidyltransferase family protein [Bacteroides intestinalis]